MGAFSEVLVSVGLLIVVAKLAEGASQHLRLNSILAYTAAGVVLGPVAGLVEVTADLRVLLGIGVYLLFFLIGLDEIDASVVLSALRTRLLVFALIAIVTPVACSFLVTSDIVVDLGLGLSPRTALALATILSLSSMGIVAKVLSDEGRLRGILGVRVLTTLLVFKLVCLPFVGFMFDEDGGDLDPLTLLALFGKVFCFGIVTYVVSNRILPPAFVALKRVLRVPHLSFGLVLGGLFLTVAGAGMLNLHGSVGALLFGAALSGLPYQVRREVVPGVRSMAEGLFVPLFFASGGLQVSFSMTGLPLPAIVALAVVPFLCKFAAPFFGAMLTGMENPVAMATGLMAKGITEIALLLVLLENGMITQDLFSALILIMFLYMIASPPLISFVFRHAKTSERTASEEPLSSPLTRFALLDITVEDILEPARRFADPKVSVRDFVEQWVVPSQHEYVVASDGKLLGLVSVSMLRYLPKEAWTTTPIADVVRESPDSAWHDEHVEDVLHRMQELSVTVLPVLRKGSGALIGSVTSQEIHELIIMEGNINH